MSFLTEKGWGDSSTTDAESVLSREEDKMWATIKELIPDMSKLDVFSYPHLFHNLKAAIKDNYTQGPDRNIYYDDCSPSGEKMKEIIKEKDFGSLPENMREAAKEAYETLLHTRDGQLCDVIVDRASLEAVYEAGRKADDEIIRTYAESMVAVADIKIAVRSGKTGKSKDFMKRAMAPCKSLDIDHLSRAVAEGKDAIAEYLSGTEYAKGAEALLESPSAFERWCDNRIIQIIRPQRSNPFSIGPVVAYLLARENEIKTVRIILSGKQNNLPEESIRERVREMYV